MMQLVKINMPKAHCARWFLTVGLPLFFTGTAAARTITITADDCDQMAVISATAPRLSWSSSIAPGTYYTPTQLNFYANMAILIRYPLDRIPKGQRITKAEWTVPFVSTGGLKQRLQARRILAEWGTGVCHDFRARFIPKEWNGRGPEGLERIPTAPVMSVPCSKC